MENIPSFFDFLGNVFSYKNLNELHSFYKYIFNFKYKFKTNKTPLNISGSFFKETLRNDFKKPALTNFYLSDYITRSSTLMHTCSSQTEQSNYKK